MRWYMHTCIGLVASSAVLVNVAIEEHLSMSQQLGNEVERQGKANKSTTQDSMYVCII